MSIQLGLIGQKISQSRSPALQNLMGKIHQLDLSYHLVVPDDVDEAGFKCALNELVEQGYTGTNVTYPYKQIALQHTTSMDKAAKRVGATNTLKFSAGKITATNTDYTGFIGAYRSRRAEQPAGDVLLLGAGGVGRAVAFALQELKVRKIYIFDLNTEGAQNLVDALNTEGMDSQVTSYEQLADVSKSVDGLINCTPIGHRDSPGNPLPADCFGGQRWAFDAVYVPIDTEFLTKAKNSGLEIISGFDLFLFQAVDAFSYFTGQPVNFAEVKARFLEHEQIHSNLLSL